MGEVLSQDEIDNLLKALSTGELDADEMKNTDERQVKDYDFARPAKFSKEHLRTLEIIFEHFGRLLATNLPAYLRKSVSVDVVNSEVVIYSEFSNALSNPVLLGVVGMDPLMGNVIMEMASNLGFAIVDRLLGGVGNSLEKERDFSEIELSILERVFTICVNLLHEPWENVVEITPRLNRIETNSQFAQIISPSETIAIVTINLKIGDVEGLMNICLPYTTLEPVMDKLNTKYWFSTMKEKDSNSYEAAIENIIDNALIPMKAVLGTSKINVQDFVNLQLGDIIRLDRKVDDELEVYVGNIKKFKALPGYSDNKYAVRVTEILREESDEEWMACCHKKKLMHCSMAWAVKMQHRIRHRIQQQIQQQIQQHHRRRTLHLLTQIKMQLVKYPISVWELQQRH